MLQDDVQENNGRHTDIYTEIATNCIRYFDLSLEQIDRLTLPDYALLVNAYALKQVDREEKLHRLAWLTVAAGAMKNNKPVYRDFSDFFDYEANLRKVQNKPTNKFLNLSRHLKEKKKCNRK